MHEPNENMIPRPIFPSDLMVEEDFDALPDRTFAEAFARRAALIANIRHTTSTRAIAIVLLAGIVTGMAALRTAPDKSHALGGVRERLLQRAASLFK